MEANRILALLFVIILLDNIAASIILPVNMSLFFKWYTSDGGYTVDKTILASGVIYLLSPAYIIASPLFGWLSDHVGRKKPLLTCLFISLFGYILLLIANYINSLLLALFSVLLCNAGSSSMTMVQAATADISQNAKRAYMLGLVVAVMLPIFLLAAQLTHDVSNASLHISLVYHVIVVLAIFLTIINILLVFFKLPESWNTLFVIKPNREDIFYTIKRFFSNKSALKLILLLVIIQFSCGLYFGSDTKYLAHILAPSKVRIFNYAEYLVMLFGIVLLYPVLIRFFSIHRILVGSILVCLVGILGCQIKLDIFYHWLFLSFVATGQCIAIATIWWLLLECVPSGDWGLSMGIKGSAWALAWTFCVLAGNSLTGEIASPASFYIAITTLLLAIPLIYSPLGKTLSIEKI